MMDYEKISKKIDSMRYLNERYDYCKEILARIRKEEDKETELLVNSPPSRNLLLEAVERGEIQFDDDMLQKRYELWKKCFDIVNETEEMLLFHSPHFYK